MTELYRYYVQKVINRPRIMSNEVLQFKAFKKWFRTNTEHKLSNKIIGGITGNTESAIKKATDGNRPFCRNYKLTLWVHEQHLETIDGLKKEVAILEKERPEGHDYVECDCSTCMALRELKTGIVI